MPNYTTVTYLGHIYPVIDGVRLNFTFVDQFEAARWVTAKNAELEGLIDRTARYLDAYDLTLAKRRIARLKLTKELARIKRDDETYITILKCGIDPTPKRWRTLEGASRYLQDLLGSVQIEEHTKYRGVWVAYRCA